MTRKRTIIDCVRLGLLRRPWLKSAGIAAFVVISLLFGMVKPTFAGTVPLTMSASIGFNGFYAKYSWVPVKLVLHDNGPSQDAVIRISVDDAFDATRDAESSLEWGVRLVHGQTVTREIAVPGWVVDRNGVVECFAGNKLESSIPLSGNQLGKVAFVAVLSHHAQAAQFLTGSTDGAGGLPVLPLAINPNGLPVEANLLSTLTAIVASPDELNSMDNTHRAALVHWVKLGGLLVVTGTDASVPDWETVFSLMPGHTHSVKGEALAQFTRLATALPPEFQAAASGVQGDAVLWAGSESSPIIAALPVGRGTVVQTAFEPGQPALLTWQNNASLWTEILGKGTSVKLSAMPPGLTSEPLDTLASASGMLAPLRVPSLPLWGAVFGLYVLIVGPVLFIVLRRLRAEHWAWLILPALSLVTTAGMYGFGLAQRPSGLLTEGTGVLDLIGDGAAESVSVRSFTSPSARPVALSTDQATMVLPLLQGDSRRIGDTTVQHGQRTVIEMDNTGRWVIHDVVASGTVDGQGTVGLQIWSTLGVLSGVVSNHTPYHFHDAAICFQGRLFELGDIAPGESVSISRSTPSMTATGTYLPAYGNYNRDLTRGIGRSISSYAAGTHLLEEDIDATHVMFVATTTDKTSGMPQMVGNTRVFSDKDMVLVREFGTVVEFPSAGVSVQ